MSSPFEVLKPEDSTEISFKIASDMTCLEVTVKQYKRFDYLCIYFTRQRTLLTSLQTLFPGDFSSISCKERSVKQKLERV